MKRFATKQAANKHGYASVTLKFSLRKQSAIAERIASTLRSCNAAFVADDEHIEFFRRSIEIKTI